MTPLHLAVLTTGRQDWGLLRPLCRVLRDDPAFRLSLIAGGMACSPAFGEITDEIRAEGFELAAELKWQAEKAAAVEQAAAALAGTGETLSRLGPDAMVVLGDRFETAAAGVAAAILGVPLVHLYGGEETEGAIDNVFRHALTKLSHLHLVAAPQYADRILQMGEAPEAVHVVGSLADDNVRGLDLPSREELERSLGIRLGRPLIVVTVHPTTLARPGDGDEVEAVAFALRTFPAQWIVTLPNADAGHQRIRARFLALARDIGAITVVESLGERRYLGLLRQADAVLGNSSSGLTEAPALGVPTVNVGDRQKGRLRPPSVVDVPCDGAAVIEALERVLLPAWRNEHARGRNSSTDESTAARIARILRGWQPPRPARKAFRSSGSKTFASPGPDGPQVPARRRGV